MRILSRNKQELWFANYAGETYATDGNNLKTGEKIQTFGTPQKVMMSINESGNVVLESNGIVTNYAFSATTDDRNCLMDEQSRVWFRIQPSHTVTITKQVNGELVTEEQEVPNPHNYVVDRKVPSLNQITYYLKEVNAS